MHAEPWMLQHLRHPRAIKRLEVLAELFTHKLSARALLAGGQLVVLVNVVMFKLAQCLNRVIQAGRSHAPRANRRAHQVNGVVGLWQPLAKNITVQSA